jgi:NAD-dependent SIR2 family protein deacetylase
MTEPAPERRVARLLAGGGVVVLSGAGLSTACGIPDYRDREGRWKRPQPIDHQAFLRSPEMRRRYWRAASTAGRSSGRRLPGRGHRALARLEQAGRIGLTVTQNVDGLHQKAGSRAVLELHGGLARVVCLDCRQHFARAEVQDWMPPPIRNRPPRPPPRLPTAMPTLPDDVPASGAGLPGLRRHAQARRGVLRRQRAARTGARR